jgi:hypothetical protein
MNPHETLSFGDYAGVPIVRVPEGYLQWALKTRLSRHDREIVRAELARRGRSRKPSVAQHAVEAGERWPCPSGCAPGETTCWLCRSSGGLFDPVVLLEARRSREARRCTQKEAARDLGMDPRRFSEMEDGRDLAPSSYGGPDRRREVAKKLMAYLFLLGRPDPHDGD